jgi:hypothetical protein
MKTEFRCWRGPHGVVGIGGAVLTACLLAAGCGGGSSSDSDGAAAAFMGHWELDGATSSFTLNCPATIGSVAFPIWPELVLDHGVLTDLTDVSTTCAAPGLDYIVDSKGIEADVANPDPYTGNPPLCHWVFTSDSNGLPVYIDFTFSALSITKLQTSSTEKAPRVLYAGTATGPLMEDDGTATGNFVTADTCSYTGTGDVFHRTTQP